MLIELLRRKLSRSTLVTMQRVLGLPARIVEQLIFGTALRERVLIELLMMHYRSLQRRTHLYSAEPPHFTSQRIGFFLFTFAKDPPRFAAFNRGVFSTELVQPGDRLLDIGCGDGFFTKRFFSLLCSDVDGIDVEPSAIATARRYNAAANIHYHVLDAVDEPFPSPQYDVVVWDGALGHFAPETTKRMFRKIAAALSPGGAFTGSESLGHEGVDHLQFFETADDLRSLLQQYFRHVEIRTAAYPLGNGYQRIEGYWRCSDDRSRLDRLHWR